MAVRIIIRTSTISSASLMVGSISFTRPMETGWAVLGAGTPAIIQPRKAIFRLLMVQDCRAQ